MKNKIFIFIIMLSLTSILLSVDKIKKSDETKKIDSKEKVLKNKERDTVNRVKPKKKIEGIIKSDKFNFADKEEKIKILRKEFRELEYETEKQYREDVKRLKDQKEQRLKRLKIDLKNKVNEIRNSWLKYFVVKIKNREGNLPFFIYIKINR